MSDGNSNDQLVFSLITFTVYDGIEDLLNRMVLTPQVGELTLHKTTAEKELNFYLGKLRTIELICQDRETEGGADPTLQRILEILYATDVSSLSTWAFMHTTP